MSELTADHPLIGSELRTKLESGRDLQGVCTQVRVSTVPQFVNVNTGKPVADTSIRFLLKPEGRRAEWTRWFPNRNESGKEDTSDE